MGGFLLGDRRLTIPTDSADLLAIILEKRGDMEQQSTLTPEQSFSLRCHRDSFVGYAEKAIASANIEGRPTTADDFHELIDAVTAALKLATEKENHYKELIKKDWGL